MPVASRSRPWLAAALLILLASCGPAAAPVSTATPTPIAPVLRAPEIRFALIGNVSDANVWALFDAKGYSYNNYAVRSEYWPRLYRLSIPDRQFQLMAAGGMPSPVQPDGDFYTATVPLRSGLTWTDGSPFTADDVVFTVNTALSFQLGFDWHDYYNPDWIDHAEAVNAQTVKFYFKQQPNVGVWQYGALQGPIVQKSYWSAKIAESEASLPSGDLAAQIGTLKARVADLQKQVDALHAANQATPANGEEARQTRATLTHQEGELDQAINDLAKAQSDFDTAMNAARESLYALADANEPTLGNWIPAGHVNGVRVNKVNPAHPFDQPHFDRASYRLFVNEDDAATALVKGEVDSVLQPDQAFAHRFSANQSIALRANQSQGVRFLVFNPLVPVLMDPAFRQALACMINLESSVEEYAALLNSFVLPGESLWYDADARLPCDGLDDASRLARAVTILKSAGYSWDQEPAGNNHGEGLKPPNGSAFPDLTLLVASEKYRVASANLAQSQLIKLGISLKVRVVSQDQIDYSIFSSHQYDLAILGWQVGEYPGYLCEWFGEGNPFGYHSDRLQSACEALSSTSDLDGARRQVFEIQSVLAQDLPFIPLYSGLTYDAYRNLAYPFDHVLGGLGGIYGAPSLAIPASH